MAGDALIVYGATGYSGRLITQRLCERGHRPVLSGRSHERLATAAARVGCRWQAAPVEDARALDALLCDARLVVNAAGPFSRTARPIFEAAVRNRCHYLDITAEVSVIEWLASADAVARRAGITVMPAVGFDVVPTDCLSAYVARHLPDASHLRVAVTGLYFLSRGSAKTLLESAAGGLVREAGLLRRVPLASRRRAFDFGAGPRLCLNVSLGDLATAYYTTGIANIETYVDATPATWSMLVAARAGGWFWSTGPQLAIAEAIADLLPDTPPGSGQPHETQVMTIVTEVENGDARRVTARLRTPEAYDFTGLCAAAVVERVVANDLEPGFQTVARTYGSDFVLGIPGVSREEITREGSHTQ